MTKSYAKLFKFPSKQHCRVEVWFEKMMGAELTIPANGVIAAIIVRWFVGLVTSQVDCCLVFNIRGNHYRLICRVSYANPWTSGTFYLKHFLTHAEYDEDRWKKDCYA
jgi:mRNA-degrading endonuclease HigB of HigAB toxin-antitoxin module